LWKQTRKERIMATVSSLLFLRHVRGEPSTHLLFFKGGRLKKSGRGLSFWFSPLSASLCELPLDDRELPFLFHARSADFQDLAVQGVITYRVVQPEVVAQRVDFTIDTKTGRYTQTPLDKIALAITELAQQFALGLLSSRPLKSALDDGIDTVRGAVHDGLANDPSLASMGLEIVSTRVSSIKPTPEMERALQMPAREAIQQQADEATFARRALAVDKERAIAENELANKIELARREEQLIAQHGQNSRRQATETAEAKRIESDAAIARKRSESQAEADHLRLVEEARVDAERDRMAIYRDLPSGALMGLAARDLAGNLPQIQHLSLGPDVLGPMLERLLQAGTVKLEGPAS
jgi:regulator of protease activity HflC (stomatin/prohibitin superfamily)